MDRIDNKLNAFTTGDSVYIICHVHGIIFLFCFSLKVYLLHTISSHLSGRSTNNETAVKQGSWCSIRWARCGFPTSPLAGQRPLWLLVLHMHTAEIESFDGVIESRPSQSQSGLGCINEHWKYFTKTHSSKQKHYDFIWVWRNFNAIMDFIDTIKNVFNLGLSHIVISHNGMTDNLPCKKMKPARC